MTVNWLSLPDSLWLTIFSNCDSIDLLTIKEVCIEWKRIAKDISLTSHLDFSSKPIAIKSLIEMISFAGNNVISLRIRGHWNRDSLSDPNMTSNAKTINNNVMKKLMIRCKQLKYLYIEDINDFISCEFLPKSLIHLSVNYCQINSYYFFYPLNQNIDIQKLSTIRCLHINHFHLFESIDCRTINKFIALKSLYMEGLMRVNDGGVTHINSSLISQLVVIDLEGTDVKDESLQYICNFGNALQELYLGRTETTGKIDFNKSVLKQLRVMCLLNTLFDAESVQKLLRTHSKLTSVNCNESIRKAINSTVLTTKLNNSDSDNTCLHYRSHRCDQYK